MKTVISTPDGYTIAISMRRSAARQRSDKPKTARKSRPKPPRFKQLTLW